MAGRGLPRSPGGAVRDRLLGAEHFTGDVERTWTLDNFRDLFTIDVYRTVTLRTLGIAVLVTVLDAVIAFPVALFMAKVASPRAQRLLVVAVLMPLWASYLVKAYAWRGMLGDRGAGVLGGRARSAWTPRATG